MRTPKGPHRERVHTDQDQDIETALQAAPQAHLVDESAPKSERVHAWVMYGFRQRQARQDEQAKIAAYTEIAAEDGRGEILDTNLNEAVEAGIY